MAAAFLKTIATSARAILDTLVRCSSSRFKDRYIVLRMKAFVFRSFFSGATCETKLDTCTPNPCRNNGVCVASSTGISCDCPATFTGSRCETPRQSCGGVSRNPSGHLQFPIGGNVYQPGLSCAWVLVTNYSLVLNVTFTRFNLEQSTDCKYDFLQVQNLFILNFMFSASFATLKR